MSQTHPEARSDRILSAARRQFEAAGFRKTSIAEIADEAGVAPGTIYWHFHSKEELFLRLVDEDNARWLAQARAALAGSETALERIAELARTSAGFYEQSRLLLGILRRDKRILQGPLLEDIHERLAKQSISLLAAVIRQGIEEGCVRPVDAEATATVLFAAGHALFNQPGHSYAELAAVLADLAIRGLGTSAAPD